MGKSRSHLRLDTQMRTETLTQTQPQHCITIMMSETSSTAEKSITPEKVHIGLIVGSRTLSPSRNGKSQHGNRQQCTQTPVHDQTHLGQDNTIRENLL
jgi:hypothetical protein